MKALFRNIAILTILLTTITACDDVEDLLDFESDFVLTEYFTVDLGYGSGSMVSEDLNISVLTKAIEPYKDKLKKVKIQKITFQIINYKGDSDARFHVEFMADGTKFIEEDFVGDNNGAIIEVTDSVGLNSLATKLLNNDTVALSLITEYANSEVDADFRVETKIYLEVTANPL